MPDLIFILQRRAPAHGCTQGTFEGGEFKGFSLEPDPVNPFHPGHPCIPAVIFPLRVIHSPHFNRKVISVQNVPGRSSIEMHGGNQPCDTMGCILPGLSELPGFASQSWAAVDKLISIIEQSQNQGNFCFLKILDPERGK